MSVISAWENFYVIVGSSAGALTGLTFVSITLIGAQERRGSSGAMPAYTTPTVVHFGVVLVLAALLSAPWPSFAPLGVVLVVGGLLMLSYAAIVVRRLLRQDRAMYAPVFEDWLCYGIVPLVAYGGLIVAALALAAAPVPALFGIAGVLLLLLADGLHNAWDIASFLVTAPLRPSQRESAPTTTSPTGTGRDG